MHEVLSSVYKVRRFETPQASRFFAQASRVQLGHIAFDFCAYDADVAIEFPEGAFVRQQICLSGSGETTVGGISVPVSRDDSSLVPSQRNVAVRFGVGYKQLVLSIDPAELLRKLEMLTATRPQGSLEFTRSSRFSDPNLSRLRNLAMFFVDDIGNSGTPWPDLLRIEFEETLLVAFLHGHRHNFSHLLERPAESAAPWQVRAAEAYIEANWNQPITVEAIAAAAGVSVRSLFKSFSASKHGSSPMAFVKTIRLRHAQDMLHRAEPTTTVSGTAFACGFQNLGHFAKQYQLLIGELPSETLAQTRIAHV
jgi:AraC-like DNA-binding protein